MLFKLSALMSLPSSQSGKRFKAVHFGKGKYISYSAKSTLLTELKEIGLLLDDLETSLHALRKQRQALASTMTPFGPLLQTRNFLVGGVPTAFPIQHPLAMLYVAMSTSDRFAKCVREAIAVNGMPSHTNPWSIVLYFDEVTCGNPLSVGDKRQVQGVYWSIYQLGSTALSDESCWFEVLALRTAIQKKIDGAMSHIVEVVLSCFFCQETHDLRTGIVFDLKGHGVFMLVGVLEIMIADTKALVEAIGSNGPNAVLPCFLCRHVVSMSAKQKPALVNNDTFVALTCIDQTKWGKHTTASMKKVLTGLAEASRTLTSTALKLKTTLSGFKHLERNFLLNESLAIDAVHVLMFDWMHLIFQTGCWNREMWQVLIRCRRLRLPSYAAFAKYVLLWHFPSRGPSLRKLMNDAHDKSCTDAGYFKSQASQGISLYCIASKFFTDVVLPTCSDDSVKLCIASYELLCDVVDLLSMSKNGVVVSPDLLDTTVTSWANAHTAAYGDSLWYPKTHKTLHLADALRKRIARGRGAFLLACWAQDDAT